MVRLTTGIEIRRSEALPASQQRGGSEGRDREQ